MRYEHAIWFALTGNPFRCPYPRSLVECGRCVWSDWRARSGTICQPILDIWSSNVACSGLLAITYAARRPPSPTWQREPCSPAGTATVTQAEALTVRRESLFAADRCSGFEVADSQLADGPHTLWSSFAFSAWTYSVFIAWLPLAYASGKSLAMCASNSPHPWVHSWYALSIHFSDSWGLRTWVSTPAFSLKMSHVHQPPLNGWIRGKVEKKTTALYMTPRNRAEALHFTPVFTEENISRL